VRRRWRATNVLHGRAAYFLNANFGLSAESDQRTASYSYSTRTHVWAAHTSGSVVRREDKCDGGLPRGFLAREGARRAGTEAVVRMCASHPPTMHSNVEAAKFLHAYCRTCTQFNRHCVVHVGSMMSGLNLDAVGRVLTSTRACLTRRTTGSSSWPQRPQRPGPARGLVLTEARLAQNSYLAFPSLTFQSQLTKQSS
jgi:hypothetical protein